MRTLTAVVVALVLLAGGAITQERRPQDVALQAAIRTETVDGDLENAIRQFGEIAEKYKSDRPTVATALVHLAGCYQKRGDAQATAIYERVVRDFADQKEAVTIARAKLGSTDSAVRANGMAYRRVWADSGKVAVDLGGSTSQDGRYLWYIDWNGGDLMLHDLAAGTDRRLTGNGTWPESNEYAEQSALSRDGNHVAYAWFNGKDRYQLRVADLKASPFQPRTVLNQQDVVWIAPYDWSPDGEWIAATVTRPDRSAELWLVGVRSGAHRKIRSLDWAAATKAFFSPDGRHVGFDVAIGQPGDNERDMFIAAVDGGSEIPVAHNPGPDRMMGWSPDGTQLLFSSDRSGTTSLWAQRIRSGRPQGSPELLKADIGHAALGITTAGAMYVGHQVGGRNVYIAEVDFNAGKLVKAPAPAVGRFIGNNEWPDWSRDGKYLSLVYARNWMGRDPSISIRSLESGQAREIPLKLTNGRTPLLAPDGGSFVTQGIDSEGRLGIFRIDARDGAISPIVYSKPDEYLAQPEFGPDGRKVYYLRFPSGAAGANQRAIIEFDLESGLQREVIRRAGLGSVYISPDGQSISTVERTRGTSAALVVPVAGGEPREVLRVTYPQADHRRGHGEPSSL